MAFIVRTPLSFAPVTGPPSAFSRWARTVNDLSIRGCSGAVETERRRACSAGFTSAWDFGADLHAIAARRNKQMNGVSRRIDLGLVSVAMLRLGNDDAAVRNVANHVL